MEVLGVNKRVHQVRIAMYTTHWNCCRVFVCMQDLYDCWDLEKTGGKGSLWVAKMLGAWRRRAMSLRLEDMHIRNSYRSRVREGEPDNPLNRMLPWVGASSQAFIALAMSWTCGVRNYGAITSEGEKHTKEGLDKLIVASTGGSTFRLRVARDTFCELGTCTDPITFSKGLILALSVDMIGLIDLFPLRQYVFTKDPSLEFLNEWWCRLGFEKHTTLPVVLVHWNFEPVTYP